MESIYSRSNKVIIDGKGGASNMLYLPLDKLLAPDPAPAPRECTGEQPAGGSMRLRDPVNRCGCAASSTGQRR